MNSILNLFLLFLLVSGVSQFAFAADEKSDWHIPLSVNLHLGTGSTSGQDASHAIKDYNLSLSGGTVYLGALVKVFDIGFGFDMLDAKSTALLPSGKPEVDATFYGLAWKIGHNSRWVAAHLVGSHGWQRTNTVENKKIDAYTYSSYGLQAGVNLLKHNNVGSIGLYGMYRYHYAYYDLDPDELMGHTMHSYNIGLNTTLYMDQVGKAFATGVCMLFLWKDAKSCF